MKQIIVTLLCFVGVLVMNGQDINNIGIQTETIPAEQMDLITSDDVVSVQDDLAEVITANNETGSLNTFAQYSDYNYKKTKQWSKYKVLNTLGWCFTGIGAGCLGYAFWFGTHLGDTDLENPTLVGAAVICGTAFVFAAITVPLFVVAHRNKVAAKRGPQLSLSLNPISTPGMGNFRSQQNLAMGLRFTF